MLNWFKYFISPEKKVKEVCEKLDEVRTIDTTPDPNCDACLQGWAIQVDHKTGKRSHIDFFATAEYAIAYPCPVKEEKDTPVVVT